jgi:hypothetical protein
MMHHFISTKDLATWCIMLTYAIGLVQDKKSCVLLMIIFSTTSIVRLMYELLLLS